MVALGSHFKTKLPQNSFPVNIYCDGIMSPLALTHIAIVSHSLHPGILVNIALRPLLAITLLH